MNPARFGPPPRARRRTTLCRGFTLVELLVALVILSTGIVLVLQAFQSSLSALGAARDGLLSDMLVRQVLAEAEQEVRSRPAVTLASRAGRFVGEYADFAWQREVQTEPAPAGLPGRIAPAMRLTVSVWRAGSSARQTVVTRFWAEGPTP